MSCLHLYSCSCFSQHAQKPPTGSMAEQEGPGKRITNYTQVGGSAGSQNPQAGIHSSLSAQNLDDLIRVRDVDVTTRLLGRGRFKRASPTSAIIFLTSLFYKFQLPVEVFLGWSVRWNHHLPIQIESYQAYAESQSWCISAVGNLSPELPRENKSWQAPKAVASK